MLATAPADSEITDDAASQVAPPEMMQAAENISNHHVADVVSISDDMGGCGDGLLYVRVTFTFLTR